MQLFPNLNIAIQKAGRFLLNTGVRVDSSQWQSIESPSPFLESLFFSFRAPIPDNIEELKEQVKPNLPWAENHFQERICGKPLNPGVQYQNWPFYKGKPENDRHRKEKGNKFSHTYMERMWPKFAAREDEIVPNKGIRYEYGDLEDVIRLLRDKPNTRQGYLPIWFAEDTGATHRERVPCTLGYQFIWREGFLHCIYHIRSCDYLRHFNDDVYLASRLTQWIANQLHSYVESEHSCKPGFLKMDIGSLHVFWQEKKLLNKRLNSNNL